MFRVFGAIGRFIRAIGYLLSGKVDKHTEAIQKDPAVIRSEFDQIIRDKKERLQEYMRAVSQLLAQQEGKIQTVKRQSEEIEKLRNLQTGAAAKAKERAADLKAQNMSSEDIKKDAIIIECQAAFADFGSTIQEKEARILELEADITSYSDRIGSHKIQLQSLQREIGKIKDEQADTIADVITAAEEKQVDDVLSGIARDETGEKLERMRSMRQQMKASAKVSSELAGTDTKKLENEYERFAANTKANAEFDSLLGLNESTDEKLERLESRLAQQKVAAV